MRIETPFAWIMTCAFVAGLTGCETPAIPGDTTGGDDASLPDEASVTEGSNDGAQGSQASGSDKAESDKSAPEVSESAKADAADPKLEGPFSPGGDTSPEFSFPEARSKRERVYDPKVTASQIRALRNGNVDFSWNLLRQLNSGDSPQNSVISALSLRSAFGLVHAMSREETRSKLTEGLGFLESPEQTYAGLNYLALALRSRNTKDQDIESVDSVVFRNANRVFLSHDHAPDPVFLDTLAENFGAGVSLVNFDEQAENARVEINSWVGETTFGKIPDLFSPGALSSDMDWTFVNAVYFKAPWSAWFESAGNQSFTKLDGTVVKGSVIYGYPKRGEYGQEDNFRWAMVDLLGKKTALLAILPDEGAFSSVLGQMDAERIEKMLASGKAGPLDVRIPEFELDQGYRLKSDLAQVGLSAMFGGDADFGAAIKEGPKLHSVKEVAHRVFFALDDSGIEAAAATGGEMPPSGPDPLPKSFKLHLNRPFLFAVIDKPTGLLLFSGLMVDPNLTDIP